MCRGEAVDQTVVNHVQAESTNMMMVGKTTCKKRKLSSAVLVVVFMFLSLGVKAQSDTVQHEVLMKTSMGDIRIKLYNETPLHRDNFIKLVKSGYYDGILFHRVIPRFMIQAGDSASRHAHPGQLLGDSPEGYKIPAEIRYPALLHKRGAVAAAREGDDVNPERMSSMSQFYIVYGKRFNDDLLDAESDRLSTRTRGELRIVPEAREAYLKYGGTPHLDGQYTVFGEVTDGMNIVNAIQMVECDANARPLQDIKILKAEMVR